MATLRLTRAEYRERFGKLPPAQPKPKPAVKQAKLVSAVKPRSTVKRVRSTPVIKLWKNEREFQAAIILECNRRAIARPEYGMIYHVPNENSHRIPGVRAGVCDLCLPVLRMTKAESYGACYIELKVGRNTLSVKQKEFIGLLRARGNFVQVVWDDMDKVMGLFEWYLNL